MSVLSECLSPTECIILVIAVVTLLGSVYILGSALDATLTCKEEGGVPTHTFPTVECLKEKK